MKDQQMQPAREPGREPPDRLKVVVYTIAKNEKKFAERWMDSMMEADAVCVLDTGSTDGTPEALKRLGAKVGRKAYATWRTLAEYDAAVRAGLEPWRFDVARNDSIDLAMREFPDADVLVCTDLDEVLLPGWRANLEAAWLGWWREHGEPPTTAQYEYVWNFQPDGSDGSKFWYEKIHSPHAARWAHPVHEILDYGTGPKRMVRVAGIRLEHHADKTKSRGQYLPLLEMSVREAPDDDRNAHYLGREYMFAGRWADAIRELKRHLDLPRARWRAERAASMRFIAKCEGRLGHEAEHERWLWRAVAEAPEQREAAFELAELFYGRASKTHARADWDMAARAAETCTSRSRREMSYLTRAEAWGAWPWEMLAIARWYLGERAAAAQAHAEAKRLEPDNPVVKGNARWFEPDAVGGAG